MALDVRHDEKGHKFYALIDGKEAHTLYKPVGDRTWDFQHTYVPDELRGQGVAEEIVGHALDEAERQGHRFFASCPFVSAFVERHPEYRKGMVGG
jgi:predicted GNAT family acetyltransferase